MQLKASPKTDQALDDIPSYKDVLGALWRMSEPNGLITSDIEWAEQQIQAFIDKEYISRKRAEEIESEAVKRGFYIGQGMGGVELEDCQDNWKKFKGITEDRK